MQRLVAAGDSLMRGKRYGQLMVFSDIAAIMQPPPFALFCIDADVLTGWKDVDAMITTMEGTTLITQPDMHSSMHACLLFVNRICLLVSSAWHGYICSAPFADAVQLTAVLPVNADNPKAGGIAGNIGINNYHMANPLICSQVSPDCCCELMASSFCSHHPNDVLTPWITYTQLRSLYTQGHYATFSS